MGCGLTQYGTGLKITEKERERLFFPHHQLQPFANAHYPIYHYTLCAPREKERERERKTK
jgi:hypothetical protein